MSWFDAIVESEPVRALAALVEEGGDATTRGAIGSSPAVLAGALRRRTNRPVLFLVAHLDEADQAEEELGNLGFEARAFPALQVVPGESVPHADLIAERLRLVEGIEAGETPEILIAPIQALMQAVPGADARRRSVRVLRAGSSAEPSELVDWLVEAGYERVDAVDAPGQFALRGGILDVYPIGGDFAARADFFGDEIDEIREIDLDTMGSDRRLDEVRLVGSPRAALEEQEDGVAFAELLPSETVVLLHELGEVSEQGRGYFERLTEGRGILPLKDVLRSLRGRLHAFVDVNQFSGGNAPDRAVDLPVRALPNFAENTGEAIEELIELATDHDVRVLCRKDAEMNRFRELLAEAEGDARPESEVRYLHRGFVWGDGDGDDVGSARPLALVPYHELLHRFDVRRAPRRLPTGRAIDTFLDLEPGDLVVHREQGIARFLGIGPMPKGARPRGRAAEEEYLTLEFEGSSKLHVPVSDIGLIQRYIGGFKGEPQLSKMGGQRWKRQKEQVAEAVRDLASDMLRIQALREASSGIRYPADTKWQHEFEAEFPYTETEDQLAAVAAVKKDMANERPMDRLICGDVGFGKTEVAIRAAFKAAEYGRQVAVLVPTTVLAEQHERTFRERFAGYPMRIESLSRFKTKKEQRDLLKEVAKGRVDVVVGTHRLLSEDVSFADLGLVIVDEEQRFGVEHKQRLLELRATADVLTMSATPIPRTLHMAMLGLRDISSLTTAPADRRAIVTEVIPYETRRIQRAIERELAREGQIFFVHNRVHDIQSVADDVQALVPDATIVVGHGQMSARELERVMLAFMRGEADILVSTTIIESGIDIPTANTMLINNADMFGLSELHQLRGRVGRYKHRAYCYLLLPPDRTMNENAVKRLRAIEEYSMLGAGFKIAMRDLEIRGAGNLLGAEQSGHIAAVGYEMYCELLQQEVRRLKGEQPPERPRVTLEIGVGGALTKGYIPSDARRMIAYRRVHEAGSLEELDKVRADLTSAYGDLPEAGERLMQLAELRIVAAELGVGAITVHDEDVIFQTKDPAKLEARLKGATGAVRVVGQPTKGGAVEIYYRPPKNFLEPRTLLTVLRRRLRPAATNEREPASVAGD